ncbi:penicillin acylase family protein [Flavobacteriaceae bacterium]|jgi:penicillin amidase|nr:penicillin acylase family protein [Flavobacteriaceae bacterium]MDC0126205.1 penicillin acylase family protein [Flavobacteriaceae bacterium]
MKMFFVSLMFVFILGCNSSTQNYLSEEKKVGGLTDSVEILRDEWGINHIYANNQKDLFFAQGYAAAQDRLFQFEIWRRQSTGTVAEILGPDELARDIGTRLFQFRGDITTELNHYHPEGKEIIESYVQGVNSYIKEILKTPEQLPLPFKMLGISPQLWTPEVVISRHQGLLGNIGQELQIGRAVALIGAEKVKELLWFHPQDPEINLDKEIDKAILFEDILAPYFAYRKTVRFKEEHLKESFRKKESMAFLNLYNDLSEDSLDLGSNNWVVAGNKTADGNTYMANDPHRTIAVPSLRYMAHLVAPGWNVIGGGEPEIPGISIGHNEFGAWGLTVFRTDGEDLYQYEINPKNALQYKHNGVWKDFTVIEEIIPVKGGAPEKVSLYYSHHGPVTYRNEQKNIAYAVRCAWLEPGGSPYLASLRMDQAQTWEQFQEACTYSNIPGENMIWADKKGNIGWQAVGIAPIRSNHSGLVPVPANGKYEWNDYLPIIQKPNALNPEKGFIATANQNVTPKDYSYWNAIGYSWSDPYRGDRVNEVLEKNNTLNMNDMKALQVDVTSLPARTLVPMLKKLSFEGFEAEQKNRLLNWDFQLNASSIEAAIYVSWENEIKKEAYNSFMPEKIKPYVTSLQLKPIIDWIENPKTSFFESVKMRDAFLKETFLASIVNLKEKLGSDPKKWNYGQAKFKHSLMEHALGSIGNEAAGSKLNLGPLPRGGNAYTPGSTGGNDRQSSGASFRMIVNTGDWDATVGTNAPGQSGNPESPFYNNLFKDWAEDRYFPVLYTKEKIESVTYKRTLLIP